MVGVLNELANGGSQVLCATHSPVIAALPGATILEVGDWGIRETTWADLELVQNWRAYLEAPQRYLRTSSSVPHASSGIQSPGALPAHRYTAEPLLAP